MRIYADGTLIETHPRRPPGARSTDYDDYPSELTSYALRDPQRLIRQAQEHGTHLGAFMSELLSGTVPWAHIRQAQKLLRLGTKYGWHRIDQACRRALAFGLINVHRVESILLPDLDRVGTGRSWSPGPPCTTPTRSSSRVAATGAASAPELPPHPTPPPKAERVAQSTPISNTDPRPRGGWVNLVGMPGSCCREVTPREIGLGDAGAPRNRSFGNLARALPLRCIECEWVSPLGCFSSVGVGFTSDHPELRTGNMSIRSRRDFLGLGLGSTAALSMPELLTRGRAATPPDSRSLSPARGASDSAAGIGPMDLDVARAPNAQVGPVSVREAQEGTEPGLRSWSPLRVSQAIDANSLTAFNVVSFGATGDGIADDGPAFNGAIAAAGEVGGGIVYAPPAAAAYRFNTSIAMAQHNVALLLGPSTYTLPVFRRIHVTGDDCSIVGASWTSTLVDYSSNTSQFTAPIRVEGARCRISDLKIEGGTGNVAEDQNSPNISITGSAVDSIVERVFFLFGGWGISHSGEATGLIVRDCRFQQQKRSGILSQSGSALVDGGRVVVDGCFFDRSNTESTQNGSGIRINGNENPGRFDGNYQIMNCVFDGCLGNGVSVLNGGGYVDNEMRARDICIVGCTFQNIPSNVSNAEGEGIAATCNGLRVIGCFFRNIEHEAVNWTAPRGEPISGCIIADNFVEDVTAETGAIVAQNGSAFQVSAGGVGSIAQDFSIVGNVVLDTRNPPKTRCVVNLSQGVAGAIVRNGVVQGNVGVNMSLGQSIELTEVDGGLERLNDIANAGLPDRGFASAVAGLTASRSVVTLADGAAPSVRGMQAVKTGGTTTVVAFTDGVEGQELFLLSEHAIRITHGTSILLAGSADFDMVPGDTLSLRMFNDQVWHETGRRVG